VGDDPESHRPGLCQTVRTHQVSVKARPREISRALRYPPVSGLRWGMNPFVCQPVPDSAFAPGSLTVGIAASGASASRFRARAAVIRPE
jgi:hypothetical protein